MGVINKFLLVGAALFITGCNENLEDKTSEVVTTSYAEANVAEKQFTVNSDGSKTYVSAITVCSADVPDDAAFQNCSFGGSNISFYASGEDFVSIDEESVQLSVLNVNGQNRLKNRKQENNYKLGSFPRISDDGKYAKWSVDIESGFHAVGDELDVKGELTLYKSDTLTELSSKPFNIYDFASFRIGKDIIVGGTQDVPEQEDLNEEELKKSLDKLTDASSTGELTEKDMEQAGEVLGGLMSAAFEGMFSGLTNVPDADEVSIQMKANVKTLEKIELYDGDKKLDKRGWSGWEDNRTYKFKKPSQPNVTLKVYYWENIKPVKVSFNL